jgi:uncharacterized membrane protein
LLVFGYLLITGLIWIAGILLIGIGILYTLPVFMCANYIAFWEVTKDGEEFEDVINHLVD